MENIAGQVRVVIAGSREFKDFELLCDYCDRVLSRFHGVAPIEVVSGKQVSEDKETGEMYGADFLGECYAQKRGYAIAEFAAQWDLYGNHAGPIRNELMAKYCTHGILFWDGRVYKCGTYDMMQQLIKYNKPYKYCKYVDYKK